MDYSQFMFMMPEFILMITFVGLFLADMIVSSDSKNLLLRNLACVLMAFQVVVCAVSIPMTLFGGMYCSTGTVNVIKLVLTLGALIVLLMAQPWLEKSIISCIEGEFYVLVYSTLLGMYMMVSAGHFLLFFLGLEMASVPMACLVAFDYYRKESAEAAAKFVLTATFSSGVMLYGISMVYAACGTLYFNDAALTVSPLSIMGLVFFFAGLGFKLSLVPFHFWTADTYQGAPTAVTGYLSVVSKGAAAFALLTILTKVFGSLTEYWDMMLYVVIVLTITVGNLFAIRQNELKRFMAFSSISQAGYIMLAVIGNNDTSMTALIYYVLVYVVANMSVFTVISLVENNGGRTMMSDYNGLYKTNPKLAFLMTLALFSLAGIPPFAGMFSKFFVFMAAAKQGSPAAYFVVFVALVNTVVSLYYYLLIVKAMYIKDSDAPLPTFRSDGYSRVALAICTAGIVAFGVCSYFYNCIWDSTRGIPCWWW